MTVADWSSEFRLGPDRYGPHNYGWIETQYDNDGNVYRKTDYHSIRSVPTGYRGRTHPSNNPLDSTGWRGQSQYNRHALSLDWGGGAASQLATGDTKGAIERVWDSLPWDAFDTNIIGGTWGSTTGFNEDYYGDGNIALNNACIALSQGNAQVGSALAETHKTFNDLASAASDLANLYNGFRHANGPQIAKALSGGGRDIYDALARRWLGYQYSWRPLVQDIHDTFQVIQQKRLVKYNGVWGKSTRHNEKDISQGSWDNNSGGYIRKVHSTLRARAVLHACIRNETVVFINKLGLLNPLSIAWELTPYSFVADWAVPVGSCLQAWSAMAGLDFKGGSLSFTSDSTMDVSWRPGPDYKVAPSGSVSGSAVGTYYQRQPISRWPIPSLGIQNPLSLGHVANAAALVASMR